MKILIIYGIKLIGIFSRIAFIIWGQPVNPSHKKSLCRGFTFDQTFSTNFKESGIEAYHIDGHTTGFTCYFFEDVFFICDYVFYDPKGFMFNPYGPKSETIEGGIQMRKLFEERDLNKVCGVDYVINFKKSFKEFEMLFEE